MDPVVNYRERTSIYLCSYVAGPAGRPATWDDIAGAPEENNLEIIEGRLHVRGGNRAKHGLAVSGLTGQLDAGRPWATCRWWLAYNVATALSEVTIVGPDLIGIRKDRYPDELPDEHPLRVIPDWVCEVLSPTNCHYDRGDKAEAYAKAGVAWYWIVDTEERTIEVLELVDGRWQIHGCYTDGAMLALPPFADVVLNVGEIFVPKKASAEP